MRELKERIRQEPMEEGARPVTVPAAPITTRRARRITPPLPPPPALPGARKDAEQRVWQRYFSGHTRFVDENASIVWPEYPRYLAELRWTPDALPTAGSINEALAATGWSVTPVDGFESAETVYRCIADGRIPIARNVRAYEHVDFSPQPDLLHDLVGHVPFCFEPRMMMLALAMAEAALAVGPSQLDAEVYAANARLSTLKARSAPEPETDVAQREVDALSARSLAHPSPFARIGRIYMWVVEFGLWLRDGAPRAVGAGLLSSHADLMQVVRAEIPLRPFGPAALEQEVAISGNQAAFYVVRDADDVYRLLDQAAKRT